MSTKPIFIETRFLVHLAMGDAYAIATEFDQRYQAEALRFERYLHHPTFTERAPGCYTDDTQMTIAAAETLLECGKTATGGEFVTSFVRAYRRDPRSGYSTYYRHMLDKIRRDPDDRSAGEHLLRLLSLKAVSTKNGAAMRSVPIGLLPTANDVLRASREHAHITHNSPGGTGAAELIALMTHFTVYENATFAELPDYLAKHLKRTHYPKFNPHERWPGTPVIDNGPGSGINTAQAVLTLLTEEPGLMAMMRRLLAWGGDTDTVAALAWGIGSLRYARHETLPEFLERDLENGLYGKDFLAELGKKLFETLPNS